MGNGYGIFFDVETTGLEQTDRIVSFAAIRVNLDQIRSAGINLEFIHLIFDPSKKSHPMAEKAHGYNDWLLRHQSPFHESAEDIFDFLNAATTLHAHNIEFDHGFVSRQLRESGLILQDKELFCTMLDYRDSFGGRSGLDNAAKRFGLNRQTRTHSALEDAWLCMGVFLGIRGINVRGTPEELLAAPSNLKSPPPRPLGPMPRRKPFKTTLPPFYL